MDSLLKQIRVKFAAETEEDAYNTQAGRTQPLKAMSFKKDKKKAASWFQRPKSDNGDETVALEFGAAIAAAAYAIILAEERLSGNEEKKKPLDVLESPLIRAKSKSRREDSLNKPLGNDKLPRWLSAKRADDDGDREADSSFIRKPSTLEERKWEESAADLKIKEKAMSSTPSLKKNPTITDKYQNDRPLYSSNGFLHNGERTHPANRIKKANDWEQAKLDKIRRRHEKMNNKILLWENEKKVKAKRRMERKEWPLQRGLEKRRAQILHEFRDELQKIGMIASKARDVVDDARRNDELKAKERAKKMRSKTNFHHKCLCF